MESQFGYHIIRLDERKPKGKVPFADVKAGLMSEARASLLNEARPVSYTHLDVYKRQADYLATNGTGKGGFAYPTSGLMGNWTIINVKNASAWGSSTPAFRAALDNGLDGSGNLVYFPQTAGDLPNASAYTADPLFTGVTPVPVSYTHLLHYQRWHKTENPG